MNIKFVDIENEAPSLRDAVWDVLPPVAVTSDWRGIPCELGRHFTFQIAWTKSFLSIRFITQRTDECVIGPNPNLDLKTLGLWNRDVCEIFIAPDISNPNRYFEFEIAPTGEWVDLEINFDDDLRITNTEYEGNAVYETFSSNGFDTMMISIPWRSLGLNPEVGMKLKGNIFRCTGMDSNRGYLAYQPTMTDEPNFHVPQSFVDFTLID